MSMKESLKRKERFCLSVKPLLNLNHPYEEIINDISLVADIHQFSVSGWKELVNLFLDFLKDEDLRSDEGVGIVPLITTCLARSRELAAEYDTLTRGSRSRRRSDTPSYAGSPSVTVFSSQTPQTENQLDTTVSEPLPQRVLQTFATPSSRGKPSLETSTPKTPLRRTGSITKRGSASVSDSPLDSVSAPVSALASPSYSPIASLKQATPQSLMTSESGEQCGPITKELSGEPEFHIAAGFFAGRKEGGSHTRIQAASSSSRNSTVGEMEAGLTSKQRLQFCLSNTPERLEEPKRKQPRKEKAPGQLLPAPDLGDLAHLPMEPNPLPEDVEIQQPIHDAEDVPAVPPPAPNPPNDHVPGEMPRSTRFWSSGRMGAGLATLLQLTTMEAPISLTSLFVDHGYPADYVAVGNIHTLDTPLELVVLSSAKENLLYPSYGSPPMAVTLQVGSDLGGVQDSLWREQIRKRVESQLYRRLGKCRTKRTLCLRVDQRILSNFTDYGVSLGSTAIALLLGIIQAINRLERAKRLNGGILALTEIQEECMQLLEEGKDVCIRLPTGAGKTVIFLVPFMDPPEPKLVLIIVPLIALLQDQLRHLVNRVHIIDGRTTRLDVHSLTHVNHILRNDCQSVFILLTPESLNRADNLRGFAQTAGFPVTIIFDEAHTIPSWGLEFRNELIRVSETVRSLPGVQTILASASISHPDINFIEECYGVRMENIVSHLYIRPNVTYQLVDVSALPGGHKSVAKFAETYIDVKNFLTERFPVGSVIIFSENKKRVNALAAGLNGAGLPAVRFHSDLTANVKVESLSSWSTEQVRFMVATSAVSLGVDNPHCIGTVHLGPPVSIYNYIQESGRVGRRGQDSLCIIINDASYSYNRMCNRIEQRQGKLGVNVEVGHILAGNSELLAWAATCCRQACIPQLLLRFVDSNVAAEQCQRCSACLSPAPPLSYMGFALVLKALLKRISHLQDKRKGCILSLAKFLSAANCAFASTNHLDDYPERSIFHNYDIQDIIQRICLMIAHGAIRPNIVIDPNTCLPLDIAFRE